MEFIVDLNAHFGELVKILQEITALSTAECSLHIVFEAIVIFLDLGLLGPVKLGKDFNELVGVYGAG